MSQPDLFSHIPRFDGADIQPADHARLNGQLERIYAVLSDGQWHTVAEIARLTGAPENSVQAQCRNLRKPRFGGHDVQRERVGHLSRYRLGKG